MGIDCIIKINDEYHSLDRWNFFREEFIHGETLHLSEFYEKWNRFTDDGWDFHDLTAYHFDTEKLAKVFYDVCLRNGVEFVDDKYIRANQNDDGSIVSLKCENGTHEADLFVDCTGFHSELLGKVMGVHYNSYADTLIIIER